MVLAQQVYTMLGNQSLWEIAVRCHRMLQDAQVPHSICGGVAVCLHGYQRNTTDIDLIVIQKDSVRIKELFNNEGFVWNVANKEFLSPSGVAVQLLMAGAKAGKDSDVVIPEPIGELNVEQREGLNVVKLSRLIEMKIASGLGSLRRTHKDFADVVELIVIRQLDRSFAGFLHPSLRKTYKELVLRARSDS